MSELQQQIEIIHAQLDDYRARSLRLFATSSFQSNSLVLLQLLADQRPKIPIYFLNTGFHFAETLVYKRELTRRLELEVVDLFSTVPKLHQRDQRGRLLFTSDPDSCCAINKVEPLEPVKARHDVWISGLRASQSTQRRSKAVEERDADGTLRYHPILQWTDEMVDEYIRANSLPRHPLEAQGYTSVGCEPCTLPRPAGDDVVEREGRWYGLSKTECGLHDRRKDRA